MYNHECNKTTSYASIMTTEARSILSSTFHRLPKGREKETDGEMTENVNTFLFSFPNERFPTHNKGGMGREQNRTDSHDFLFQIKTHVMLYESNTPP